MKFRVKWEEVWGTLIIMAAACLWGGSASLGKTLMQRGLPTLALMQVRSVITASILFVLLLIFSSRHLRVRRQDLPALIFLAVPGLALVNASYYYAVRVLPVAIAVFIQFTAPVVIFLFSLLRKKESLTTAKVIALVLCMVGTFLMVRLQHSVGGPLPWAGLISAVVSMLTYAFYIFQSHNLGKKHSPWTINLYGNGIAAIFWCLVINVTETWHQLSQNHLFAPALLFAVSSTLVPFTMFLVGLRRVTPTEASIASTSETIAATVFAFVFLGEALTIGQLLGAAFIFASILTLILHRPEATPEVV